MEKIIYSFLKEIKDNEDRLINGESAIIPSWENYEMTKEAYGRMILNMEKNKLIDIKYRKAHGLPVIIDWAYITEDGEKFLVENSKLGKCYKGLKNIKEYLKLEKEF